jgi:hypothetical protein
MTHRRLDPEAGAVPPADPARAYARRLAAASIADGDDTGWFETLYVGDQGAFDGCFGDLARRTARAASPLTSTARWTISRPTAPPDGP